MLRTRRRARPASCARGTTRATPPWLLRQPGLGLFGSLSRAFPPRCLVSRGAADDGRTIGLRGQPATVKFRRRATPPVVEHSTMAGKTNKASKPRKTAPKSQSRKVAKPALLSGGNPQIAKGDCDPPCRPTSRPCPAGNATSGAASMRSSCALSLACARRSNGTRRCTESRARAGSSTSIPSRATSRWLS